MTKLEKEVEQKLRRTIEKHGGLCLKWVCPGWSGVPDRIILLPGGHVLFVETKRPKGGQISRMQEWWANKLRRLGFPVWFVQNVEQIAFLELCIFDEMGRNR